MIRAFTGSTADELWGAIAETFIGGNTSYIHQSRCGETREMLHVNLTLENPQQRWIFSRRPALNVAFAIAEVVWIVRGRKDSAFLTYWNRQLPIFVGDGSTLHGAYGYRLRSHFQIDQLNRAYSVLRQNPESRQVVLQIWDSEIDFPALDGSPVDSDIPCNLLSLLKARHGRLEWMQIMRSNDVFLGLPYNLVQFTCLQEILAGWLGLEVGSYNQLSDSLHVYQRNIQNLLSRTSTADVRNEDSLMLPKTESDRAFAELEKRIEVAMSPQLSERQLMHLLKWQYAPPSFKNLLSILIAESARRHYWKEGREFAEENCENTALLTLWHNWCVRVGASQMSVSEEHIADAGFTESVRIN